MTYTLRDILERLLEYRGHGYLSKDGFTTDRIEEAVVEYRVKRGVRTEVPDELVAYLRRMGESYLIRNVDHVVRRTLELRRLSDGATAKFSYVFVRFKDVDALSLHDNLGFEIGANFYKAWAYHLSPEDYLRLRSFLSEAGVKLDGYVPPWIKDAVDRTIFVGIMPSSERPGKDADRFLGFG